MYNQPGRGKSQLKAMKPDGMSNNWNQLQFKSKSQVIIQIKLTETQSVLHMEQELQQSYELE